MYLNHYLELELDRLEDIWNQCAEAKTRFAFYKYLASVFELYADLRAHKAARWSVKQIVQQFDKTPKYENHPIRLILDVTCTADRKTKSRWTRALRFAWHQRRNWKDLGAFFRRNGGPAGCSQRFTQIKPKRLRHVYYKGPAARPIPAAQLKIIQERTLAARPRVDSTFLIKERGSNLTAS